MNKQMEQRVAGPPDLKPPTLRPGPQLLPRSTLQTAQTFSWRENEGRWMALEHLCCEGSDLQAKSCSRALESDLISRRGRQRQVAEASRRGF